MVYRSIMCSQGRLGKEGALSAHQKGGFCPTPRIPKVQSYFPPLPTMVGFFFEELRQGADTKIDPPARGLGRVRALALTPTFARAGGSCPRPMKSEFMIEEEKGEPAGDAQGRGAVGSGAIKWPAEVKPFQSACCLICRPEGGGHCIFRLNRPNPISDKLPRASTLSRRSRGPWGRTFTYRPPWRRTPTPAPPPPASRPTSRTSPSIPRR